MENKGMCYLSRVFPPHSGFHLFYQYFDKLKSVKSGQIFQEEIAWPLIRSRTHIHIYYQTTKI